MLHAEHIPYFKNLGVLVLLGRPFGFIWAQFSEHGLERGLVALARRSLPVCLSTKEQKTETLVFLGLPVMLSLNSQPLFQVLDIKNKDLQDYFQAAVSHISLGKLLHVPWAPLGGGHTAAGWCGCKGFGPLPAKRNHYGYHFSKIKEKSRVQYIQCKWANVWKS